MLLLLVRGCADPDLNSLIDHLVACGVRTTGMEEARMMRDLALMAPSDRAAFVGMFDEDQVLTMFHDTGYQAMPCASIVVERRKGEERAAFEERVAKLVKT